MKIKAAIAVFLLSILYMTAPALSLDEKPAIPPQDLRVFEGRVVSVDRDKSTLKVQGATEIEFAISRETKITRDREMYDMELSDIDIGDYVTVHYVRSGLESRIPQKVLKVIVIIKKSKI